MDQTANLPMDPIAHLPTGWLRKDDLVYEQMADGNEYAFLDDLDTIVTRKGSTTKHNTSQLPQPKGNAETDWKAHLVKAAPSGERIVNSFRSCRITRIQHVDHLCNLFADANTSSLQLHVFKNGGTTIASAVLRKGGRSLEHGKGPNEFSQSHLTQLINNAAWFRTALIRDPMERALSAFHEIKARMMLSQGSVDCSTNRTKLLDEFHSMLNYVEHDADPGTHVPYGYHFLTQTHFMIDSSGAKYYLDYIGNANDILREEQFILQDTRVQLDHKSGPTGLDAPNCRIDKAELPVNVQSSICRIYRDDYCCYGFAFPAACSTMTCPAK